MAADFDATDPSSPLAYDASQTALLLLDYHNLVVNMLGDDGKAALAKAKKMRDWALSKKMLVMHSIIDIEGEPRNDAKGRDRFAALQSTAKQNPEAAKECSEIAADISSGEIVVLKQLGFVSGLKAKGAMDILRERNVKSLVICGLSTSGAVLRTSLGATDDGFSVTVIEDACADRDDGLHEMLMKHAIPMTAHVSSVEEFIGNFEGRT